MKSQISRQINLAQHIIDGSIAIDSTKTFKSILQIFPHDPALHKAFADFLIRKKSRPNALKVYSKAAKLYIDMGMILQAVVCKLIQWRLQKPSPQEARLFYQTQRQGSYHETPLNQFFDRLSYSELIALINRMDLLRLSAGQVIKKIGDEDRNRLGSTDVVRSAYRCICWFVVTVVRDNVFCSVYDRNRSCVCHCGCPCGFNFNKNGKGTVIWFY